MESIRLSISAGNGPEECAYSAALTLQALLQEAETYPSGKITATVIAVEPAQMKGNIRSALISLAGTEVKSFAASWTGVIQWIWRSAYRPHHKRKNWFVSVSPCREPVQGGKISIEDVRFETSRAGGPGGQYVNKTESAVRAVHIPTGTAVCAREARSQLLNKKSALARLASVLDEEQADREKQSRADRRHTHYELERGNPIRVYDGPTRTLLGSSGIL